MLCSNCNAKEATFHYKYIKNGSANEMHLCRECAESLGYIKEHEPLFGATNFLGDLFSLPHFIHTPKETVTCPVCGTGFDKIRKTGFVGCDKCYEVFSAPIDSILSKIQPSTVHIGKLSGAEGKQIERDNTLKSLKEELQRAILDENYEHAAVIRDKIKAFEKEEGKQNG